MAQARHRRGLGRRFGRGGCRFDLGPLGAAIGLVVGAIAVAVGVFRFLDRRSSRVVPAG